MCCNKVSETFLYYKMCINHQLEWGQKGGKIKSEIVDEKINEFTNISRILYLTYLIPLLKEIGILNTISFMNMILKNNVVNVPHLYIWRLSTLNTINFMNMIKQNIVFNVPNDKLWNLE